MRWHKSAGGYILPATIMLGLAISIVSTTFLQYTASTSDALNTQSFNTYAQEAAKAGIAYANSCIKSGVSYWASPLQPDTSCDLSQTNGSHYVIESPQGDWRSTFSVTPPATASNFGSGNFQQAVSTGIVEILQNGSVVRRIYATKISDFQKVTSARKVSKGLSITAVRGDRQLCAIANGKLYCWGGNSYGQVGDGTTTDRSTPTLVNGHGAITANMIVTEVSTADRNTCAIADGQGYCWGNNDYGQIGDNTTNSSSVPVAVGGLLAGKKITDLTIAPWNTPYLSDQAYEHACANLNGVSYCWGSNGYTQLTDTVSCGSCMSKVPVVTDSGGPLYGKKVDRIAASSHDSCEVSEGNVYCWGVQAPVIALCTVPPWGWYTFLPNPAPFNCDGLSGGSAYNSYYNASADPSGGTSDLKNKVADKNTFQFSTDLLCTMANKDFICFGKSPAISGLWAGAYNPATTIIPAASNPDVTDNDNGESYDNFFGVGGLKGYVCAVDYGSPKCLATNESYYGQTVSGGSSGSGFQPLYTGTGLGNLVTTRVAAASDSVCTDTNGQLFCFGNAIHGALANNSTGTSIPTPTHTGTVVDPASPGSTAIGTYGVSLVTDPTNYTYAASGSISVGGGHACAIINGDVYCWGNNASGQAGTGDTTSPVTVPSTPSSTSGTVATKVSAGGNHTCAISKGVLYCWGENSDGQLGLGDTTDRYNPTPVATGAGQAFYNKRITDVSAGDTGTCAIANGQAYCWGKNANGEAGTSTGIQNTPNAVGGISAASGKVATAISMGYHHACAVVNGDAYCWGSNNNCALAIVTLGLCLNANYTSAQKISGSINGGTLNTSAPNNVNSSNVTTISAGNDYTCAIANNVVSCWGSNSSGQIGVNSGASTVNTPTQITNSAGTAIGLQATTISTGSAHTCATLQGVIYCWGSNSNGQLGNNDSLLLNKKYAVAITGGDTNCNGTTCGGDTTSGTVQATINVAAGATSSCSVSNGKILCWGNSSNGLSGLNGAIGNILTPKGTSDYVFQQPYYKGPIF